MYKNLIVISCLCLFMGNFSRSVWAQTEDNRVITGVDITFFDYKAIPSKQYFLPTNFNPGLRMSSNIYLTGLLNYCVTASFVPRASYPLPNGQYSPQLLFDLNTGVQFKANNGLLLKKESFFAPYIYTGIGFNTTEGKSGFYVPASLGFRFRFSEKLSMTLESMYRQKLNERTQPLSHSIGFIFVLSNKKTKDKPEPIAKKDKVPPKKKEEPVITFKPKKEEPAAPQEPNDEPDPTPVTPRPKKTEPVVLEDDTDGDGIKNDVDGCPDEPGSFGNAGCPEWKKIDKGQEIVNQTASPKPFPDRDKDGIRDDLDGCPDQAAPKSEGGCPPIHIVAKAIDEEIDRNEVYGLPASTSLVSKEVTPVVVPDPAPPTNYTAMRTPVDNAQVTEDDLKRLKEISQILRYKPKSAQLDPTSTSYIGEIQQIISKYPNHKLVITGYYGEDSDEEENKILSVTRAFEIKKQLLFTQNQAFSKIESDGFGSEKVGRGKGRGMIEFQLVPKK